MVITMTITIMEFLNEFTKTHEIQTIEDINGVVIAPLNKDYYLINTDEVEE